MNLQILINKFRSFIVKEKGYDKVIHDIVYYANEPEYDYKIDEDDEDDEDDYYRNKTTEYDAKNDTYHQNGYQIRHVNDYDKIMDTYHVLIMKNNASAQYNLLQQIDVQCELYAVVPEARYSTSIMKNRAPLVIHYRMRMFPLVNK